MRYEPNTKWCVQKYRIPEVAHAQNGCNEDGIDHEDKNSEEEAVEATSQDNRQNKSKSAVWEHFCVEKKNICLHCKRTVIA